MRTTKAIVLLLSLCLSFNGFAGTSLSPVRSFVTKLANKSAPKAHKNLNKALKNPTKVEWKTSDPELTKKVLEELQKKKAVIQIDENTFIVKVNGLKIEITLLDYFSRTVLINGVAYTFSEDKNLRTHIDGIIKIFKKRTTFNNPLIEDANAFLPLVFVIPAIIAASGAAVTVDALLSTAVNDMKNMDPKTQEKINKLKEKYKQRADACESDLENAKASNSKGQIEQLTSVRTLGQLHKVLNTELYNKWFNGKSQINYDELSCTEVAQNNDISSGTVTGFTRSPGRLLGALCKEQDRLNTCFASTEDVMRDQGIQINELRSPDRRGPFEGIYEEYKEIKNIKK